MDAKGKATLNTEGGKSLEVPVYGGTIGPDVIDTLVRQTGLSKEELLSRLSRQLPEAVDRYTPEGRLGTAGA